MATFSPIIEQSKNALFQPGDKIALVHRAQRYTAPLFADFKIAVTIGSAVEQISTEAALLGAQKALAVALELLKQDGINCSRTFAILEGLSAAYAESEPQGFRDELELFRRYVKTIGDSAT